MAKAAKKEALGDEARALFRSVATEAVDSPTGAQFRSVNLRITMKQLYALQDASVRRFRERGGVYKANVSEVARELIDEWMARGCP